MTDIMPMARIEVYLSLGSNMGDRKASLEKALEMIGDLPGTTLERVSDMMETEAVGFEGADFLNCCCRIATELEPLELLERLKGIEEQMGRRSRAPRYDEDGKRIYSDRPIDIDILLYGDLTVNEETLQIPHPHMLERDFVMVPLNEIRNN